MGRSTDNQNLNTAFNGGRISEIRVVNPRGNSVSENRGDADRLRPFTEVGSWELRVPRGPHALNHIQTDVLRQLA